jgi:hypothetical protein
MNTVCESLHAMHSMDDVDAAHERIRSDPNETRCSDRAVVVDPRPRAPLELLPDVKTVPFSARISL